MNIETPAGPARTHPDHVPASALNVCVGGYSSAGRKSRNDDAFAAHVPQSAADRFVKGVAGCIADGISSSENSHLASQTAVQQFTEDYYSAPDTWSAQDAAARSLTSLNRWLAAQSRDSENKTHGWITTFSALILKAQTAHLFHVGDCRIYLYRNNTLNCLTRDHVHTIGGGETLLTGALGADNNLRVDYQDEPLADDDLFLLLSDGVCSTLDTAAITGFLSGAKLSGQDDLERAAQSLCALAEDNGSDDNLSCLMMKVVGLPHESVDETHRRLTHRKIPPPLSIGNKIDHYKVERVLHSGTRSHVYLVRDLRDEKHYVLKAPSPNFEDDLTYLEGFAREQWVGQHLNDQGLMKVLPKGTSSPFLYAILEYVGGSTLRQWMIDNPRPPLSKVRSIIGELIRIVRVLHRSGMVHRDLKPENIMVSEHLGLKLVDFGTIKIAGLDELRRPTGPDAPQGSVDYVAPETLLGEPATGMSDLFSIGCIAYEMLTGSPPYRLDPTGTRWPKSYAGWSYRPARYIRNDIPEWVDNALEKCVAADPDRRYQAMSEFLEDIKRPGAFAQSRATQTSLKDRDPLLFWKGVSLVLAVIAILQFLLLQAR